MLLTWKILLFMVILILAGLHDFWLGPKASRLMQEQPDSPSALRARKTASWLGRINLFIGLIIILLAVMMIRGIPA
jgi:putative copper export protein